MHDGNDDDLLNSGATSIFKDNTELTVNFHVDHLYLWLTICEVRCE